MDDIVVVGSGIGGLCSAVRLLHKGFKVTILEKEKNIGGKVNIKKHKDFRFDLTASILMTSDIYTDIFKSIDRDYRDYFTLINIDPIYNVFYEDGTNYSFYSDIKKMILELNKIEIGLSEQYERFLYKTLEKYLIVNNKFLNKPMLNLKEIINLDSLKSMIQINPLETSDSYISGIIKNEKLKNYLDFQAMYMGVDPYTTSNLYSMIPAISHGYGLSYIKGGFYEYICALKKLVNELGGKIKTSTEVEEIIVKNNEVKGVRTKDGIYKSNIVICNADYPYAAENLFNRKISRDLSWDGESSCSVFIIYLGLRKKYDNLNIHNIFLSSDFKNSIQQPFKGEIPKNPSIYIYCPSSIDESVCGSSKSVLNIMVRVPNLSYKSIRWDKITILKFRNKIINKILKIKGLEDIEDNIEYEEYLTPEDLKKDFYAYEGSAFGISHKLTQSVFFRPSMKSEKIKGLYFIGSSTHPGNGVSIIIEGTRILSYIIIDDYF